MPENKDNSRMHYPLPPQHLRFMGEDDQKFLAIGDVYANFIQAFRQLKTVKRLLDVGCGYGRLAHALLRHQDFTGQYYGFDILPQHIAWCQQALGPLGKIHFGHLDIRNARYNPTGRHSVADIDFSAMPKMDVVTFFSVFTHMYEEEIRQYLGHAANILAPGGMLMGTAFLLNDASRAGEQTGKSRYPMPHRASEHARYFNADDPLHAIGYEEAAFLGMVRDGGFVVEKVVYGGWCGRPVVQGPDPYQDLVVATTPTDG